MLKISQYGEVVRIDSARTLGGRGYYWSTSYLVDGMLIDTGCAHSAGELIVALDSKHVVSIVNTHSHEDHIGANGVLQEKRKGLEIFAHPFALRVLENPKEAQPLQLYRRVMWGWPRPSKGNPVWNGEWIETGRYAFQVIYTPGHSPDHICLYEQKQGWLFSGDLFVGGKDRALRAGYDIWQIIASLKRVAELPLNVMYPGCARVRDNPGEALKNKIVYLEEMGSKVLQLNRQGLGEKEIVQSLFGGPMLIEFVTTGHFSRRHLVRSYLGAGNLQEETT
jgi:glyoxylase-like metal-dependent hydrolase (beta-lactamase superfamily II)